MRFFLAQRVSKTLQIISAVLPRHTRRLVLWCSLYSQMCGAQKLTKEQCARLNGALDLSKDNNALLLPSFLCKFILPDLEACSKAARDVIRGEKTAASAAEDFIGNIPSWLRYASDEFVAKDFQQLRRIHQFAA